MLDTLDLKNLKIFTFRTSIKKLSNIPKIFVECHGKSDIDGHFGLFQKVFNNYERVQNI